MAEERNCLMTMFGSRADSQSLRQFNHLLDTGWRIAQITPTLQRLPGAVKVDAFVIELTRSSESSQASESCSGH